MGQSAKCPRMGIVLLMMGWCLMMTPYSRADDKGAVPAPVEPLPKSSASKKFKHWADRVHDDINQNFILYASKTDRWLSSNDLALEENDASRLKLSLTTQYEDEEFSFHPSSKLRLALPLTKRRYQITLDRFSNETMPAGERDINDRRDRADNHTDLGMRFIGISNPNVHRHVDVGFSLPNILPYIRANASWSRQKGPWTPRLTCQVSWEQDDGLGAKVPFEAQRELVPRLWFKSYSEASWLATEAGIYFVQDLSLHWLRTDWDAFSPLVEVIARNRSYDFDDNGYDHPDTFIEKVWFSVRYRRQIYKD
ncbi:MAG: hypothetical protein Q7J98_08810 [Kiritimatiellia bacterium]|nr:hypothetical protein [Kiritimatiellia bacterium]